MGNTLIYFIIRVRLEDGYQCHVFVFSTEDLVSLANYKDGKQGEMSITTFTLKCIYYETHGRSIVKVALSLDY